MKLTIPAPQNIKRRESFLLAHPDYYGPVKTRAELLKIAYVRAKKNLRWDVAQIARPIVKEMEVLSRVQPTKVGFIDRFFKK